MDGSGDGDVEVDVMVGGGPAGGQDGLGAAEFLGSALLEAVHGLVVPDLIGEVSVGNGDLGRHVGHNVCVVDDPVSLGNAGSDVVGEILVTYAWLSEGVELINVSEKVVDVQGGDSGQS